MVLRQKPEKVEERERIRLSLLRATVMLAARHGFAGLGLREVARGADIAPTSFYRHFADMEELGLALIDELIGPLLARWNELANAPSPDPRSPLYALIDQALQSTRDEPELMRFVLAERVGAVPTCRIALHKKLDQLAEALRPQLPPSRPARGKREDSTLDAVASAAVTLLLQGCADSLELVDDDMEGRARVRRQLDLQLRRLLSTRSDADE